MKLCVDLGGTSVKVATAAGDRLSETVEFPVAGTPADLDRVVDAARRLAPSDTIGAVAVAVPGIVDAAGRRLLEAHGKYEWLLSQDLVQWGADSLGATVAVENDARAALIGEATTGVAAGESNAVILVLGTGIGTAAIVDGVPLRGLGGSAGILCGHLTVDWNGPRCNCGNIGCAEVYGGSWALGDRLRDAARGAPVAVDPAQGFAGLTAAARAGDTMAADVLDQALRAWSVCAVTMCHAYNPRVVVLAGGVARAADIVVPRLEAYLDDHLWSSLSRPPIRVAREPELSVLRGLAALATDAAS